MKARVRDALNATVVRLLGGRGKWWFSKAIRSLWRELDREAAWSDFRYFIDLAPATIWGGVGGDSYTGWVYQQGFLAALVRSHVAGDSLNILDFGCGVGKFAPVGSAFAQPHGAYLGLDIREDAIAICRAHYAGLPNVRFVLSRDFNQTYSDPAVWSFSAQPSQAVPRAPTSSSRGDDWPIPADSLDVVVSVSVFTHLQEEDALGYMDCIHAGLRPGGIALLTFHVLEEPRRPPRLPFVTGHLANLHDFHTALPPSRDWFTSTPDRPEDAIAVNRRALDRLNGGRFETSWLVRGSVTGGPDPFPQSVVLFRKLRPQERPGPLEAKESRGDDAPEWRDAHRSRPAG